MLGFFLTRSLTIIIKLKSTTFYVFSLINDLSHINKSRRYFETPFLFVFLHDRYFCL